MTVRRKGQSPNTLVLRTGRRDFQFDQRQAVLADAIGRAQTRQETKGFGQLSGEQWRTSDQPLSGPVAGRGMSASMSAWI
jgi:hypothetical protein